MGLAPILLSLLAAAGAAEPAPFGAVSGAPLSEGSLALFAQAGYPELRVGFRQGLERVEIGADGGFDLLRLRLAALGQLRAPLVSGSALRWALEVGAGGFAVPADRAGGRPAAVRSAGLAVEVGSTLTWRTSWPVAFFAQARLPLDVALTSERPAAFPTGAGTRLRLLMGGGAEIAVAPDRFVSFTALFGPEASAEGTLSAPLAVEALVGLGWRLF